MTSKERILATLRFELPDRIGVYDRLSDETIAKWREEGIPSESEYQDYFEYDIWAFDLNPTDSFQTQKLQGAQKERYQKAKEKNRFLTFSTSEPFQRATEKKGLQEFLTDMAARTREVSLLLGQNTTSILKDFEQIRQGGLEFDGVWLWGDLAYKDGPFFSPSTYRRQIYPLHKELCSYFNSLDLPVIFHSDGDLRPLIPDMIKAGIRALHPLESYCMDIRNLKREFGKDLVLFGNISILALEKDKNEIESHIKEKLEIFLKEGGYIYSADGPIPPTVSLENYKFVLKVVREYGEY